jgi:hypothetical protein
MCSPLTLANRLSIGVLALAMFADEIVTVLTVHAFVDVHDFALPEREIFAFAFGPDFDSAHVNHSPTSSASLNL